MPISKDDEFNVVFRRLSNSEGEMIATCEDGEEVVVDPFVGCAWEYEQRAELIGRKATIKGSWHWSNIFLIDEKGINFIPLTNQ